MEGLWKYGWSCGILSVAIRLEIGWHGTISSHTVFNYIVSLFHGYLRFLLLFKIALARCFRQRQVMMLIIETMNFAARAVWHKVVTLWVCLTVGAKWAANPWTLARWLYAKMGNHDSTPNLQKEGVVTTMPVTMKLTWGPLMASTYTMMILQTLDKTLPWCTT